MRLELAERRSDGGVRDVVDPRRRDAADVRRVLVEGLVPDRSARRPVEVDAARQVVVRGGRLLTADEEEIAAEITAASVQMRG